MRLIAEAKAQEVKLLLKADALPSPFSENPSPPYKINEMGLGTYENEQHWP